ncbi:MAG TPA: cyclic nucleotide-binding domain-containing protein, partial [Alphaproteobacteria bacterium]|nr:cyclic nucleotide-binding domain-containing protein [Alphaproteobacteria bacterium]
GLVVNYDGQRRLSPSSWKVLIRTWEQISFWATSLIFLLAAMMVPDMLAGASLYQMGELALLIVAAFAARAVTLYGLLPALSFLRVAEHVGKDHKLVILWGGMRGAVSLALALAATQNAALPPETRQFVGVLASGFILFTLFVGAPTVRPLMRLLRLDRLSPADLALRDRVTGLYLSTIGGEVGKIAREHGVVSAAIDEALQPYSRYEDVAAQIAEEDAQLPAEPRLRASVQILIGRERELYLQHFEARTMSRRALSRLVAHVTILRDAVKPGGIAEYRKAAKQLTAFSPRIRLLLEVQRRLGIARPLASEIADRFEAHLTARVVIQELRQFNASQLRPLFGDGPRKTLDGELAIRFDDVGRAIEAVVLQYPAYARALQAQFLALRAIGLEEGQYQRLRDESVITPEVFNDLSRNLRSRRRLAERRPKLDLGLRRADLIARVSMFSTVEAKARRKISRLLRPRLAVPGEMIVHKGDRGDSMYFISSGAVEVQITPDPVRLGTGDFFGELALLNQQPRNANVVAIGYCQLLRLAYRDFNRLMRANADLRREIHIAAEQRLEGGRPAEGKSR